MRKSSSVISFIIMLLTVAFIAVPRPAAAFVPIPVAAPKVWEVFTQGVEGDVVPMYTITTKPKEWYQLKSDGIKVDGATKICHPFDEGRHGWSGAIFQLVEGTWVKLATTVGWVPDAEGDYKACAQAPAAGTYALFAYFTQPAAKTVDCEAVWDAADFLGVINSGLLTFGGYVDPAVFPNVKVMMTFYNVLPAGAINPLHYSTYTDAFGNFMLGPVAVGSAEFEMDLSIAGCQRGHA